MKSLTGRGRRASGTPVVSVSQRQISNCGSVARLDTGPASPGTIADISASPAKRSRINVSARRKSRTISPVRAEAAANPSRTQSKNCACCCSVAGKPSIAIRKSLSLDQTQNSRQCEFVLLIANRCAGAGYTSGLMFPPVVLAIMKRVSVSPPPNGCSGSLRRD